MCDAHLEDYISMQRTYTQMGLYHLMVTYGARGSDEAARKGLGAATDYIFASGWWSDLLPYPQVKAFTDEVQGRDRARRRSGTTRARTRPSARIFAAIQKAGSLKPEAIRAALASLEIKDSILPGGVLKFSKTGQAVLPFVVTQNKRERQARPRLAEGSPHGPAGRADAEGVRLQKAATCKTSSRFYRRLRSVVGIDDAARRPRYETSPRLG